MIRSCAVISFSAVRPFDLDLNKTWILKLFEHFHKEKQRKLNEPDQQGNPTTGRNGDPQEDARTSLIPFSVLAFSFLLFLLLALTLHHAGFSSPMLYDSKAWINDKAHVFASHDPLKIVQIMPVRPLCMLTLYANYLLTGMDPYYFRLVNATILAATGAMLMLLIVSLLEIPGMLQGVPRSRKHWIGLLVALFFVCHPLQTFVVLYIWQREAILACFFYFSCLVTYLAIRTKRVPGNPAWYAVPAMLFFLGLLCKENLVTVPVVLLMAELILFRQNFRQLFRTAVIIGLVALPLAAIYATLTANLYGPESVHETRIVRRLLEYYSDGGLTPVQVVLTECRVFFSYLRAIVAPFPDGLHLVKAEIISRSLLPPPSTLPAVAGMIGLIGAGIGLCRKKPLASFGILFFVITLAPESLLIPQFLFFGYRPILPMAGFLLVVAQALAELTKLNQRLLHEKLPALAAGTGVLALFISFGAVTWYQAKNWNPGQFWERAFRHLPPYSENVEMTPYVSVLMAYGGHLVDSGHYGEAIEVLSHAIRIGCGDEKPGTVARSKLSSSPSGPPPLLHLKTAPCPGMKSDFDGAYYNLGIIMLRLGDTAEAIRMFRAALDLRPDRAAATNGLGEAFLRSGDVPEAVRLFRKAIELQPGCAAAINNLGNVMLGSGKVSEAIDLYRKGLALTADAPELHNNLGAALLRLGNVSQARDEFRRAAAMRPRFAKARVNLGLASLKLGDATEALENLNAALEIDPGLSLAYLYRGQARELSGNVTQAVQDYAKAIEVGPDPVQAHYCLARALAQTNNIASAIEHYQKVLQLNPRHYLAQYELGCLFLSASQFDKASQHLRKALEIRPDLSEARTKLGLAEQGENPSPSAP
jgi:protein O-mannosyl-transferase